MSWITLLEAKERLGIDCADPSQDTAVQSAIDYAVTMVESYCQRNFAQATYVDYFYPYVLTAFVKNWPVASVDKVELDGEEAVDPVYQLDKMRGIVRFDQGLNNWTSKYEMAITYTGGFATIPEDLKQATLDIVMARFQSKDDDPSRGAVKFERIDGSVSVSYGDPPATDPTEGHVSPHAAVLNRYRSEVTQGAW